MEKKKKTDTSFVSICAVKCSIATQYDDFKKEKEKAKSDQPPAPTPSDGTLAYLHGYISDKLVVR